MHPGTVVKLIKSPDLLILHFFVYWCMNEGSCILDEVEDIKLSSSPRPNSEFMRLPPDGAEKIKIIDEL